MVIDEELIENIIENMDEDNNGNNNNNNNIVTYVKSTQQESTKNKNKNKKKDIINKNKSVDKIAKDKRNKNKLKSSIKTNKINLTKQPTLKITNDNSLSLVYSDISSSGITNESMPLDDALVHDSIETTTSTITIVPSTPTNRNFHDYELLNISSSPLQYDVSSSPCSSSITNLINNDTS